MNYQSRKSYKEERNLVTEKEDPPCPELSQAQKDRMERIKSALNRTARERRMATSR